MPFTIEAAGASGPLVFTCSKASETLNKILELEQRPHASITQRSIDQYRRVNWTLEGRNHPLACRAGTQGEAMTLGCQFKGGADAR
jgi:hypothetical protein